MSSSAIQEKSPNSAARPKPVTVRVNKKKVDLRDRDVTGLEIKEAAIAQGVEIELDFLLTREARKDLPASAIGDHQQIRVNEKDRFIANDVDDDS